MLEDALRAWNPWWAEGRVPAELLGTDRALLGELRESLALRHVKDVLGPRRAGKTTLLHQLIHRLLADGTDPGAVALVNFDDPAIHAADLDDLLTALSTVKPEVTVLVLDEVQERDGWERWVRTLYDTRRFEQLLVTGSSSSLLESELGRVLTGRHLTYRLYPFSFREALEHRGWERFNDDALRARRGEVLHHLRAHLDEGGFPEAQGQPDHVRKRIHTALFHDIVSRDVVARHGADPGIAERLANVLLQNSGAPFTFRRLANATGVAPDTAQKYVRYLEEAFLLVELPPWSEKVQERYRGPRKFYAVDHGLAHSVSSRTPEDVGARLEAVALLELLRRGRDVHHWRDERGREVDLVVHGDEGVELWQVAYSVEDPATRRRELRALKAAMEAFPDARAGIWTWDEEGDLEAAGRPVHRVPLWTFLLDDG